MITPEFGTAWHLGVLHALAASLATMLVISLGYLRRPSRATLYWTSGFTLAMVATIASVAAELNDAEMLRRLFLGALLGAPALLWSGFRAYWGVRPLVWVGPLIAAASATALAVSGDLFTLAFRAVLLVGSLSALLYAVDWVRLADRRDIRLIPLAVVSTLFGLTGLSTFVAGLVLPAPTGDAFEVVRSITSLGMFAYLAALLFAILGIVLPPQTRRVAASLTATGPAVDLADRVRARLAAAAATGEPCSVVYVRLDDATEIRQAAGAEAFAAIQERVTQVIRSAFPDDAEFTSDKDGTYVLVVRSDAVVREVLRSCLDRIGDLDVPGRLPIHPTASAGWANTSTMGYDLSALALMAREAANLANQNGGDRWERMSAAVVQRLLTQAAMG